MKSANTIWTILGIVVLLLIIGYFTNWFGMGKQTVPANKMSTPPQCVTECPNGKTEVYPCSGVPKCLQSTSRLVIVPRATTTFVNPELI